MAGLHIDPLAVHSKFVVDATGHPIPFLSHCHDVKIF